MCPSAYRASCLTGPAGGRGRGQTCTKQDRWGCGRKISLNSVQGFGFPLTLHKPTDTETYN